MKEIIESKKKGKRQREESPKIVSTPERKQKAKDLFLEDKRTDRALINLREQTQRNGEIKELQLQRIKLV